MGPVPFEDVLESRLTDLRANLVHHHRAEVNDLQDKITTLRNLLKKDGCSLNEVQSAALKCDSFPCPPDEAPPDMPPINKTGVPGEILDVVPTSPSGTTPRTPSKSHSLRQLRPSESLSTRFEAASTNGVQYSELQSLQSLTRQISDMSWTARSEAFPAAENGRGSIQSLRPSTKVDDDDGPGMTLNNSSSFAPFVAKMLVEARHGSADCLDSRTSLRTSGQEDAFTFTMLPVWNETKRITVARHRNSRSASFVNHGDEDDSDDDSNIDLKEAYQLTTRMSGFASKVQEKISCLLSCSMRVALFLQLSPNTLRRGFWDMAGVIFIVYEFVVLPLQLLDLPESTFLTAASWVIRLYWTLDFPASFFKSYHQPNGGLEKRPARVAMKYVRTWMVFDLAIVIVDWLDFWSSSGAARLGRFVRLVRWVRMVRLFRLLRVQERLPDFARAAAYFLHSERCSIVMSMIKMVVFFVGVAHLFACLWLGLGNDSKQEVTWLGNRRSDLDLEHRYAVSMHWALTQFAGAADIYPTNFQERTFAIIALIFGFLISVSVVSSLTSNLTRLQIVTARSATQMTMLNQYLYDNHISTKIALRVQRNVMYALEQETKNTPESKIELLNLVSGPLRVELHYEINLPILSWHDFFGCYNLSNSPAMRRICHMAISRLALCRGDILFNQGEIPPKPSMFFCMNGKFHYQRYFEGGLAGRLQPIRQEQIFCEQVLWTQWVHLGQMRARSESNLFLLDAEKFQSIASQFQTREFYPKKYAKEFVEVLVHTDFDEISDVSNPDLNVQEVCTKIFPAAFTRHLHEQHDPRWSARMSAKGSYKKSTFKLPRSVTKATAKLSW